MLCEQLWFLVEWLGTTPQIYELIMRCGRGINKPKSLEVHESSITLLNVSCNLKLILGSQFVSGSCENKTMFYNLKNKILSKILYDYGKP